MNTIYSQMNIIQTTFNRLRCKDVFFEPLYFEYNNFNKWFLKKSSERCFVTTNREKELTSFFYMKEESEAEDYSDLTPIFFKGNRLKIGTLLIQNKGNSLGNAYMEMALSHAYRKGLDEVYITFHNLDHSKDNLSAFLRYKWGFSFFGSKGEEMVYLRHLKPLFV